jgi:hypothetical protein
MMNRFARWTTVTTVLGLLALGGATRAEEEKIAFNRLPKAVRKTVKARFPNAEIKEAVEEEADDGETTYEVSLEFKGHAIDLALSPNGKILEIEQAIEFDELPRAVKLALAARHPEAKVEKVEVVSKGGAQPYFELLVTTEVQFTPKGKLIAPKEKEEGEDEPSAKAKKSSKESEDEDDRD